MTIAAFIIKSPNLTFRLKRKLFGFIWGFLVCMGLLSLFFKDEMLKSINKSIENINHYLSYDYYKEDDYEEDILVYNATWLPMGFEIQRPENQLTRKNFRSK